jgi:hypothetical protein
LISEFVSQENKAALFPFITWLHSNGIISANLTSEQVYKQTIAGLEKAGSEIGWIGASDSKSLLGFYLATRSGTAAIQAYYQFYEETVLPSFENKTFDASCGSWVDWYGRQLCKPSELDTALVSYVPRR